MVARIRGVTTCHISTDTNGEVSEVHVVAARGKSPKLISRDVETCLKAAVGVDVDYKKIGVVVLDEDTAPAGEGEAIAEFPIEEHPSRFAFQSVNVFASRDGTRAEVELVRDGMEAFGTSRADQGTQPAWTVIAEATLRAVSEYLDEPTRLCLGGISKVEMGNDAVFAVRVDMIGARGTKTLAGCTLVGADENQSIVFATLDAVNRVIGKLEFKSAIEYKIR